MTRSSFTGWARCGSRTRLVTAAVAVLAAMLAYLAFSAMLAQPAFASSNLSVGQYVALAGVPNSSEYDEDLLSLKAKSSDSSVVSCSARKPEGYVGKRELFAYARGFGQATVTVSWTLRENVYNEKTGKSAQVKRKYSKSFEYRVLDAVVKKAHCDHLFAGSDYTLSGIFKGVRTTNHVSILSKQAKGSFTPGRGYSVSVGGKKVRFDSKCNDVVVNYSVDGATYPIRIAAIHSKESLSNKVVTAVKKLCYYPSTLKVKSASLRNGKLYVSFSAVNLAGVRNSSRVCAYFDHGTFKFEKVS